MVLIPVTRTPSDALERAQLDRAQGRRRQWAIGGAARAGMATALDALCIIEASLLQALDAQLAVDGKWQEDWCHKRVYL